MRAPEGLLTIVSLHMPLEVAGVVRGEGAQAAGKEQPILLCLRAQGWMTDLERRRTLGHRRGRQAG